MPESLCIFCNDQVTPENGDPLYLKEPAGLPDAQPAAWVHHDCLAEYARPFEIADIPQSELDALRDHARASSQ